MSSSNEPKDGPHFQRGANGQDPITLSDDRHGFIHSCLRPQKKKENGRYQGNIFSKEDYIRFEGTITFRTRRKLKREDLFFLEIYWNESRSEGKEPMSPSGRI